MTIEWKTNYKHNTEVADLGDGVELILRPGPHGNYYLACYALDMDDLSLSGGDLELIKKKAVRIAFDRASAIRSKLDAAMTDNSSLIPYAGDVEVTATLRLFVRGEFENVDEETLLETLQCQKCDILDLEALEYLSVDSIGDNEHEP